MPTARITPERSITKTITPESQFDIGIPAPQPRNKWIVVLDSLPARSSKLFDNETNARAFCNCAYNAGWIVHWEKQRDGTGWRVWPKEGRRVV